MSAAPRTSRSASRSSTLGSADTDKLIRSATTISLLDGAIQKISAIDAVHFERVGRVGKADGTFDIVFVLKGEEPAFTTVEISRVSDSRCAMIRKNGSAARSSLCMRARASLTGPSSSIRLSQWASRNSTRMEGGRGCSL